MLSLKRLLKCPRTSKNNWTRSYPIIFDFSEGGDTCKLVATNNHCMTVITDYACNLGLDAVRLVKTEFGIPLPDLEKFLNGGTYGLEILPSSDAVSLKYIDARGNPSLIEVAQDSKLPEWRCIVPLEFKGLAVVDRHALATLIKLASKTNKIISLSSYGAKLQINEFTMPAILDGANFEPMHFDSKYLITLLALESGQEIGIQTNGNLDAMKISSKGNESKQFSLIMPRRS